MNVAKSLGGPFIGKMLNSIFKIIVPHNFFLITIFFNDNNIETDEGMRKVPVIMIHNKTSSLSGQAISRERSVG